MNSCHAHTHTCTDTQTRTTAVHSLTGTAFLLLLLFDNLQSVILPPTPPVTSEFSPVNHVDDVISNLVFLVNYQFSTVQNTPLNLQKDLLPTVQ